MKFLTKIYNSKGIALAQVLILAGLMGGMTAGVLHLVRTVNHAKEQVAAIATIDKIVSDIKKVLTDEKNCQLTFAGVNSNGGVLGAIRSDAGSTLYSVNSDLIFEMSRVNLVGLSTSTDALGTDAFNLLITFEKADRIVTKKIKIFAYPDNIVGPASRVKCFAEKEAIADASRVLLCQEIGGTVDAATGECGGAHRPILESTRQNICADQGGVWDAGNALCTATPNQATCAFGVKGFDSAGNPICCGDALCTIP